MSEAVLEIRRHRQVCGAHDHSGMGQRLIAGQAAILKAQFPGRGRAGGSQRLKTGAGQNPRGSDVPRIWNDERARALV